MVAGKYQQYIKTVPFSPFWTEEERREREEQMRARNDPRLAQMPGLVRKATTTLNIRGDLDFGGVDMTLRLWNILEAPFTIEEEGFVHNFHQYLVFLGTDLSNTDELNGEAAIYFGKEKEKHIIDKPTVIHTAPGLVHSPLEFTRIDRPLLYMAINTTPFYARMTEYN